MPKESADSSQSASRSALVRLCPAVLDLVVAESSRESCSPSSVREQVSTCEVEQSDFGEAEDANLFSGKTNMLVALFRFRCVKGCVASCGKA